MRFELTTLTLARLCSTPELRPRPFRVAAYNEKQAPSTRGKLPDFGNTKGRPKAAFVSSCCGRERIGAGDEIRTHDPNLGKVMLYP